MKISPIKDKSIVQRVIDSILVNIEDGTIKPGEKIESQRELAEELNVSMGCVREALQSLVTTNIIEIKPGKGAFLKDIDFSSLINPIKASIKLKKDELLELFEVRKILESACLKKIILNYSEDNFRSLKETAARMRESIKLNDRDNFLILDLEFHKKIIVFSVNNIIINFYETILDNILGALKLTVTNDYSIELAYKQHSSILKNISDRNYEAAYDVLEVHLNRPMEMIKESYVY